ncbi:MAG: DegT/DnrJ/EryC1/StrS family aminotransferase [Mesorhizobium sp.]|nr:DegT/DnrJ/EryC1/StrS family aminotransferase [Mesorhizobium sp.]
MIVIPQAAPSLRFARYGDEVNQAVGACLASGTLVLGPQVEAFEAEFAFYCGLAHAVGVGSGTDAISLALRAAGIGAGDEVIVPALTAAGTAQAVRLAGASPVYADIDPSTRGLSPDTVRAVIGPRTAGIVLVHLYGSSADPEAMAQLAADNGLFLLEDCAQAHGATRDGRRLGTFGGAAAFSFYPTKNLGAAGDGGCVVTSDPALAARVRLLRNFGWADDARISSVVAGNTRLDEIQAAVLRVMLRHLDDGNRERAEIAAFYRSELADLVVLPRADPGSAWHQFVIEVGDREGFRGRLAGAGVGSAVHYWPPLHRQPALAPDVAVSLPATEAASARVVSLPIQPEVALHQKQRIVAAVRGALRP